MNRLLLYGAPLLTLSLSTIAAMSNPLGCGDIGVPATAMCVAQEPIILAQQQRSQTLRVPGGQTYQVQIGNGAFKKFAAGTVVPATDCVMIKCPSTFGDDVTCWKCVENLKAN